MVHALNSSYSGGRARLQLEASPGKKVSISTNKPDKVVHACDPIYAEGLGRRTVI
jgi:hypothetical protein